MKLNYRWAAWLWAMQALTGLALVLYIVIHTLDNAMILLGQKAYEDMLRLWHSLPGWFYVLMVLGLLALFLLHMGNGIRIASKPYKQVDFSWKHNWMLKHPGTGFWFTQVLTGSAIAVFAIWHFIVQHGAEATMTATQSAARVTPTVFVVYFIFLAAVMFHSFNGVRSILLKLGVMTDTKKETILVVLVALAFIVFFLVGIVSVWRFIPPPEAFSGGEVG